MLTYYHSLHYTIDIFIDWIQFQYVIVLNYHYL